MARFANAGPPLGGETGWPSLFWLAGLLEGEGSFLRPVPSNPGSPIISCRMTDLDVVELVAAIFGTSVQANDKGRHKTEYATTIRGSRCAELMRTLRPMMGERRRTSIDRAIQHYVEPERKLDFKSAEEIRARHLDGESVSSLARSFGVQRQTIHQIRDGRMYPAPEKFPWLPVTWVLRGGCTAGTGMGWAELYWLAGWLEGEGSFLKPPPSSPRSVRVLAQCSDYDVISEVGRLLRVRVAVSGQKRNERRGWSRCWRVELRGGRAVALMDALAPILHRRRSDQITRALAAAKAAGAKMGWQSSKSRRPWNSNIS